MRSTALLGKRRCVPRRARAQGVREQSHAIPSKACNACQLMINPLRNLCVHKSKFHNVDIMQNISGLWGMHSLLE